MDVINQLILLPSVEHQGILPFLIAFMLLLHLPFLGMTLIASLLSLLTGRRDPGTADAFRRLIPLTAGTMIVFVVLPLLSLVFLYRQYLFQQPIPIGLYLLRIFPLLLAGILLTGIYQRSAKAWAGLLGLLLNVTGLFFLFCVLGLVAYPQKWPFVTGLVSLVFSITIVTHFALFLTASCVLTGTAALFLLFRWPERRLPEDSPARAGVRGWSLGLLVGGALLLPLLIFWDLYNRPDISLSAGIFWIAFLQLFLLLLLSLWGLSMLRHGCQRHATTSFTASVLLVGLFVWGLGQFQATANRETLTVLAEESAKALDDLKTKREALAAKAAVVDVKLGEKIYNERCSACHRFDQKLVGPPYYDVLPKYKDNPEKLQAFIRNPVKMNPAYPPMPNQGLREVEVKSVAAFLLEKLAEKK